MDKEVTPHKGQFPEGVSGNPKGRPKGSKNKITLLKLMAEQAVRENNQTDMEAVCSLIVAQAMDGDRASQKLVWASVVSNGISDDKSAAEKVQISITGMPMKAATVIDNPPQEDIIHESD